MARIIMTEFRKMKRYSVIWIGVGNDDYSHSASPVLWLRHPMRLNLPLLILRPILCGTIWF